MQNINVVLQKDFLPQLIQQENFVGWTYGIDYQTALVMTNDLWKARSLGIPHNCFLVAATFDPEQFADVPEEDREVLLLRVIGSANWRRITIWLGPRSTFSKREKISTGRMAGKSTILPKMNCSLAGFSAVYWGRSLFPR